MKSVFKIVPAACVALGLALSCGPAEAQQQGAPPQSQPLKPGTPACMAAAIAAGEPGLSGADEGAAGPFFCCASAGAPVRARPRARPAADKIRERLFIPILLDYRRYRRSTTRIP